MLETVTDYLFIPLQTQDFIYHLQTGQTGTQLPHISGSRIGSFVFPLPPMEEQFRIVNEVERRLSAIQVSDITIDANLARAERLRQEVLGKAFAGKLVPQDHNDEPASMLLEAIREERKRQKEEDKTVKAPGRRKAIMNSGKKRRTFQEILKEIPRITADDLFKQAGYEHDQAEAFFENLRIEVTAGRIRIVRMNEVDVFLEPVSE